METRCPRCLSKKYRIKSAYFAICYDCGKWYVTNPIGMYPASKFVNPQQRKFYLITRVLKIANITVAAFVLLFILRSVLGD